MSIDNNGNAKRNRGISLSLTALSKKKRKNQAYKDRNRRRISIGDHVERCIRAKTELNLSFHKKNREVAGILLNMFMVYLSHVFTSYKRRCKSDLKEPLGISRGICSRYHTHITSMFQMTITHLV